MRFLDTNVILRYLTRDDPEKAARCYDLFQRAKSTPTMLVTSESVISEVVYVLSSPTLYKVQREQIRALLLPIINLPGLQVAHRRTYSRALDLYVEYPALDFEDALSVAHMEWLEVPTIVSYDRDFDRVKSITREEP